MARLAINAVKIRLAADTWFELRQKPIQGIRDVSKLTSDSLLSAASNTENSQEIHRATQQN